MADNEKLKELYNDIKSGKLSNDEIKDLFDGHQCYIPKEDFGELMTSLFGEVSVETMKIMLKSRKGKLYSDYYDKYGDSYINLFMVKCVSAMKSNEKFIDKINDLIELMNDNEIEFKWDLINGNHENNLHVMCLLANYFKKETIIQLLTIFKNKGFNPLNVDDMHRNAFDLILLNNKHNDKDTAEIIKFMEEMSEPFTIEVDNYIEEETETVAAI